MRISDWSSDVCSSDLLYPPQFAADCFGLTTRRLKDIEDENGIEIRRVPRGTVTSRAYTLRDIFDIAALRRAKGYAKGLRSEERRVGKSVSVRVDFGGRSIIKKKQVKQHKQQS